MKPRILPALLFATLAFGGCSDGGSPVGQPDATSPLGSTDTADQQDSATQAGDVQSGVSDTSLGMDTSPIDDTFAPHNDDTFAPQDTAARPGDYYAIFLDDLSPVHCATSSSGAHGSDIDAVALWDGNDLVGYLDITDAWHPATGETHGCAIYGFDDQNQVKGAPQASPKLNEGFYSLAYGWLIGEFEGSAELLPGYEVTVYEIDDDVCRAAGLNPDTNCIGSEPYALYVATDLDCVNTGSNFRDSCMVMISDTAEGTTTMQLNGF